MSSRAYCRYEQITWKTSRMDDGQSELIFSCTATRRLTRPICIDIGAAWLADLTSQRGRQRFYSTLEDFSVGTRGVVPRTLVTHALEQPRN